MRRILAVIMGLTVSAFSQSPVGTTDIAAERRSASTTPRISLALTSAAR